MPEYESPDVIFEGLLEPGCGSPWDFVFELDE